MSNVQIPNLPAAIALNGAEQLEAVQAGASVKINVALLGAYLNTVYPFTLGLQIGSTEIIDGAAGNLLYDNAGVLGEISVVPVGNGGTGATSFGVVSSKTSNYVILADDNYKDFDNNAAAGSVTFTLPPASIGLAYGFAVMEAQNLIVSAPGGVVIYLGGLATSAGGNITSNTVGSYLSLKCRSATEWMVQSSMGSWTPS